MTEDDVKKMLKSLSVDNLRKLFPRISDEDFERLVSLKEWEIAEPYRAGKRGMAESLMHADPPQGQRWFDKPLVGLSKEGNTHLKELVEQLSNPSTCYRVDRKQIRYLKQLKKMRLTVPDIFRAKVEPKEFYQRLVQFCKTNDIPQEIVLRVVPSLVDYLETGHMRPIIFVGEKGSGKTTAVRLLVEEALHINTEVIKIPQTDGSHGLTGHCGTYVSADVGYIAKARLNANNLLIAYLFDEIDKGPRENNCASVDEELLSITDESCNDVFDTYLETKLVGLEHCPMFMTANDIERVNPILADRCTVIHFPNADAARIKSISRKYADRKLTGDLYRMIRFDYDLMNAHIDNLIRHNVTSLRKHQQMIEAVLANALNIALDQELDETVPVTEEMFEKAEKAVLGSEKHSVGFRFA